MNENIDLTKILKDCPKGWKFWSPIFGEIEFYSISLNYNYPIILSCKKGKIWFSKEGLFDIENEGAECVLFPSKDQRDWSKFTAPWLEKQGKPNPYSGVSFKYNGHTWGMCARDNGVEILVDGQIKERIFLDNEPQGKSALEAIKEEKVDNEPKFKVGDWIVNKFGDSFHIDSLDKKNYQVSDGKGNYNYFPISQQDKMHLWTIQDAKDGDVLATWAGAFIYNGNNGGGSYPGSYCGINNLGNFQMGVEHHWTRKKVYPAIKEQRDALMKAMKDAGYEWDAEKKELKKLVPNKFDPKTLKPFDKVLVRDNETCIWKADFYSHKGENRTHPFKCVSLIYKCCIPYNEDTKHLVGTKEDAPEYYRYWED